MAARSSMLFRMCVTVFRNSPLLLYTVCFLFVLFVFIASFCFLWRKDFSIHFWSPFYSILLCSVSQYKDHSCVLPDYRLEWKRYLELNGNNIPIASVMAEMEEHKNDAPLQDALLRLLIPRLVSRKISVPSFWCFSIFFLFNYAFFIFFMSPSRASISTERR